MRVFVLHRIPSLKFVVLPVAKIWVILVTAFSGLVTSRHLNEVMGHYASFLPIFSFLYPSVLDLRSGMYGTDDTATIGIIKAANSLLSEGCYVVTVQDVS